MPVGVPKVPYSLDGSIADWVDIYNRLSRQRILFLCSELSDETSNQLIGLFVYLNAEEENNDQQYYFYINSPGGGILNGLGVYDIIQYVDSDVSTIAVGAAESMASLVLAGGTIGKRIALSHSRAMIHEPESGISGTTIEVTQETTQVFRLKDTVYEIYSEETGQSVANIIDAAKRDYFLSAEEAKDFGLVDLIGENIDELEIAMHTFNSENLENSERSKFQNGTMTENN